MARSTESDKAPFTRNGRSARIALRLVITALWFLPIAVCQGRSTPSHVSSHRASAAERSIIDVLVSVVFSTRRLFRGILAFQPATLVDVHLAPTARYAISGNCRWSQAAAPHLPNAPPRPTARGHL